MTIRKINYIGWLGYQNLGDELIYREAQQLFNPYKLKPYDNYRFLNSNNTHYPKFQEACSQVSIFGGGTLLPDDITWIKPARYNYLFGAAVKDPIFCTPYDNFEDTLLKRLKSFNFRMMGVRDDFSKESLANWGIESEVIGDPALSIRPNANVQRDEYRIAINVGCDGFLWGNDQNRIVRELVIVCKILKDRGYSLILVPFSKQDLPYIRKLAEETGVNVFNKWANLQAVVDLIASSKILIGERLHSIVISAATFTPFICFEYKPKCVSFSESVGFSQYCIRTDRVQAKHLLEILEDLLDNWDKMENNLQKRVEIFREKQKNFVKQVKNDLELIPESDWDISKMNEMIKSIIFWNPDVLMRKNIGKIWRIYNKVVFLRLMKYIL